jgi:hypothetical protein
MRNRMWEVEQFEIKQKSNVKVFAVDNKKFESLQKLVLKLVKKQWIKFDSYDFMSTVCC